MDNGDSKLTEADVAAKTSHKNKKKVGKKIKRTQTENNSKISSASSQFTKHKKKDDDEQINSKGRADKSESKNQGKKKSKKANNRKLAQTPNVDNREDLPQKAEDVKKRKLKNRQNSQNNVDINKLNKLNLVEQIKAIYDYAVPLDLKIDNEEKERFALDKKVLMQILEKIEKMKNHLELQLEQIPLEDKNMNDHQKAQFKNHHLKDTEDIGSNRQVSSEKKKTKSQGSCNKPIENENEKTNQKETESHQVKQEKTQKGPVQILNIHQYFQDNLDTSTLKKLNLREQIDAIYNHAVSLEPTVDSFNEEKDSIEYFVLDEKLMQLLEKLDKMKCRNNQEIIRKNETVNYINGLHKKLDLRCEENIEEFEQTSNYNEAPAFLHNGGKTHDDSNKAQVKREEAPSNGHQYPIPEENPEKTKPRQKQRQAPPVPKVTTELRTETFDNIEQSLEVNVGNSTKEETNNYALAKTKCQFTGFDVSNVLLQEKKTPNEDEDNT